MKLNLGKILAISALAGLMTGCGAMQNYNQSLDANHQAYARSQLVLDEQNIIELNKLKSLQRVQEIQAAKAEGEKAQAKAAGDAQATIEQAKGEAAANKLLQKSLTPEMVQYHLIDSLNDKSVIYMPNGALLNMAQALAEKAVTK